jgi:myo-inositol catabolism protein IolS
MKTRPFGKLDFQVSEISFGGAAVSGEGGGYGFGNISEADALTLIRSCFDRGINLFDTAPCYGFGESERRIGKAFKGMRDKVFIVSKCGVDWDDKHELQNSNDPKVARKMLERSLKDLGSEYIDLYFIHWPDEDVDVRRTMEVLAKAKDEGKIRAIGLSNHYDVAEIRKAMSIAPVDVLQSEFNLFKDEAKLKLFALCKSEKLGYMSWGTFDKGILTGRVTRKRTFDDKDFRGRFKAFTSEAKMKAVDRITPLLKKADLDGRQLALGYVLRHGAVSTALCGVRSPEQLDTALAAHANLAPEEIISQAVDIAHEELQAAA